MALGRRIAYVMAMTQPHRPVGPGDHVFLIDGSSFVFRAYYQSIRQDQKYNYRTDRLPTGAVRLFATKVLQFIRDGAAGFKPTHLAIIFDKTENSFRRDIYPAYKAHRKDPPDELVPQFPLMRATVSAFGMVPIEQGRYEADDIIATYARQAREAGADVLIVSADKDLMQLVEPCVTMYDPASGQAGVAGSREERRFGVEEVIQYFEGVGPDKVVDVQALAGDSTDNVPGAPGIGLKTAAQLILEYGDLETLLSRAGEIKQPKRREALTDPEIVKRILISKQLVTLDRDVPVETPLEALATPELDGKRLVAFCKAMELTTLTRRVAEICGIDASSVEPDPRFVGRAAWPGGQGVALLEREGEAPAEGDAAAPLAPAPAPAPPQKATPQGAAPADLAAARAKEARAPIDRTAYKIVRTGAELSAWIARALDEGVVAIAAQTSSPDPLQAELIGLSLAVKPGEACYIPIGHRTGADDLFDGAGLAPDQMAEAEAVALLKPLLEAPGVLKIGHDLKFDMHVFAMRGVRIAPIDDAMLLSYTLDAGATGDDHSLVTLSERFLGHKPVALSEVAGSGRNFLGFARATIEKACEYGAEKADIALRLRRVLQPRLVAEKMTTVYERLERPLVEVLARMERRGIAIDRNILSRMTGEFSQRMAGLEAEIDEIVGAPFNPGSPKQLGDILFGQMGLPGGKKTATGAWSTTASVLEDLAAEGHQLPARVLEWRQISKLKSTYTDALPGFVNPRTGRVHTAYALASTTTGRLSSSEPNLQNIPIRTEEGRKIRRAFVAPEGRKLISADYSQIELQASCSSRRHTGAQAGVCGRTRHSRHDRLRNVRRADPGHAGRSPAARQGHQFRHHLWYLGLRPRQSARHRPQRGGRLHQEIFRALPRHPRLHGGDEEDRARQRLRHHSVRPQVPLSAHQRLQSFRTRIQRTGRHQRAAAGLGGRHHPPRDGPHGRCAGQSGFERGDAAHRPRRIGVRGARRRGRGDAAGGGQGDGRGAGARGQTARAPESRRPRGAELGGGALVLRVQTRATHRQRSAAPLSPRAERGGCDHDR